MRIHHLQNQMTPVIRWLSHKLKGITVTSLRLICASPRRERTRLRVAASPRDRAKGLLQMGALTLPCALGRAGLGVLKREGDGKTPLAPMAVLGGFYRADRWPMAHRAPWLTPLKADLGWCDAPAHPNYNRAVPLPFAPSHEVLAREDGLYDCVLILGWNIAPRARNRGSAIFLHLARPGFQPTEGCIALARADMARLLRVIGPGTLIRPA
jgi:L,D-peptidoglycan transpeptidase YkuD (ErfK/YbiS/YcfS/YnhG family)